MRILAHGLLLAPLLVAAASSQVLPGKPQPAPAVVVEIVVKAAGTAVPRVTGEDLPAALAAARRWQDRQIAFRIHGQQVAPDQLLPQLTRIAEDESMRRERPDQPGLKELLPLRIVPGDGVRWREVVDVFTAACEARFRIIEFADAPVRYLVPKSLDEPVVDQGVLVVPPCLYNEPDDLPHALRPLFDVHQDGRIGHAGAILFTPQPDRPDDLAALAKVLQELRAALAAKDHLRPAEGDRPEQIDVPVMIRADQWAEWRAVRRLLQAVTEPQLGFWKIELGVAERDHDAARKDGD